MTAAATRRLLPIALLASLLACGGTHASGAEVEWTLAHYLPKDHFFATGWLETWTRTLERDSGGRLRITIRPNNELLRLGAIAPGIRDGKAELGFGPAPDVGIFKVVDLPFTVDSAVHGARTLARLQRDGRLGDALSGLTAIALHTNAPSVVHSKLRPVRVPRDLLGQRMRGATPYIRSVLAALGATPIEGFLAPQVYGALRDGHIDGTVFPYEAMGVFRLGEQLRHHTEVPLFVSALGLFVNPAALAALPADLRELVMRRAGEALSLEIAAAWDAEEHRGRDIARALGNEIIEPSARERALWVRTLEPFARQQISALGPSGDRLAREVRAAAQAARRR
jgi:TRAP-type transport system periplasmic protein